VIKVILLRFGEIHLKGRNKGFFQRLLLSNLKTALSEFECKIAHRDGRYIVSDFNESEAKSIASKASKVFGFTSYSIADKIEAKLEFMENYFRNFQLPTLNFQSPKTFRFEVKRADKTFPVNSDALARHLGGVVLEVFPEIKVDLHSPQLTISVDIRSGNVCYVSTEKIPCHGGLPVGSSGRSLVLLSGGIDSPVAAYMMAKRGMQVDFLHFHSYPYTSKEARNKVIKLAQITSDFAGKTRLYICSFTKIQEEIHKRCKDDYMITIMRRFFMRIAERLCIEKNFDAIITGENLAQVASQTVEGMTSTDDVLEKIPAFRPVLAFDKTEIIALAQKIGTFETSILPYEDCCTAFLPKNPLIKPNIEKVEKEELRLNIIELIEEAIQTIEIVEI